MKKFLIAILIFVVCFSMSTIAFAAEPATDEQTQAESIAEVATEIVGANAVNDNIVKRENAYSVAGDGVTIEIPVSGICQVITEMDDGEDIVMSLPKEVSGALGLLTRDGTVVYNPVNQDVAVSVQALQENRDGVLCDSVRTLLTMKNEKAPNKYSFDFDLPEGYSLVKDYDYDDEFDEYDCGQVFVVDDQNETICTIDTAGAKDANGEDVKTFYVINGSTLTQVVEFDENTAFPIVADSNSHPHKTSYYCLKKAGVKKLRDKYTEQGALELCAGLVATAYSYKRPVVGVCNTFVFINKTYSGYKYASWNSVYAKIGKQKVKVTVTFRWKGGKNDGYVPIREKVTYID